MKKKSIVFYVAMGLIIGLMAFKKMEQKKYSVSLSEQEWNSRYTWVMVANQMLQKSNLPINEVKPLNDSLNKFLNELQVQLLPQMRPAADSTKKNK